MATKESPAHRRADERFAADAIVPPAAKQLYVERSDEIAGGGRPHLRGDDAIREALTEDRKRFDDETQLRETSDDAV